MACMTAVCVFLDSVTVRGKVKLLPRLRGSYTKPHEEVKRSLMDSESVYHAIFLDL